MNSADVSLLVAAVGVTGSVGGTALGVWITQRKSDDRERIQWQRARQQEHEHWAREGMLRTFERRCASYVDFEECLSTAALAVEQAQTHVGAPLEDNWQLPVFRSLLRMQIFATPQGREAGNAAYGALWRWGDESGDEFTYDNARDKFMEVMRLDLGIEADPQTDPPLSSE